MASKIIKYLGILIIVGFSAVSIFFALAHRDIGDQQLKKFMSYTTFFEDRFFDFRMKKTLNPDALDKRLVLAALDDITIQKLGQWPIPRENWAILMNKLKTFGAKIIAYDVFFSQMSRSCSLVTPEEEMAIAIKKFQEIEGNKVIIPYSLSRAPINTFESIPDVLLNYMMVAREGEGAQLHPHFVELSVFPLEILSNTEAPLAHIQASSDPDGIFRHYSLVGNIDGLYLPSFALSAYQHYTGDSPRLEILGPGHHKLFLQKGTTSLNYNGEMKVRWLGGGSAFPIVPMWQIMEAKDDDPVMHAVLGGNIVFVGSTAFGAHDLRHTPVDSMLPGIYFHMNAVHMLLEGKFSKDEADSTEISWGVLIGGTIIMLAVMFLGNPLIDLSTVVGLIGGLYYIDTYYLLPAGYEIKLFFCFFSIVACYSWNTFLHFYLANKDKQFLKNAFGTYISPELIDEMYKTGESPRLGGDSGVRTAFFTDIQGFSSFSEKLSATQLVELLNEYLTAMTDILLEEKGTLDKYEGDAIIAFFGAPMPLPDHASRACLVSCRMQEKLLELRAKWTSEGDKWPAIVHEMRMRIGINAGEIVTGNMGSKSRMNYTMMGDAVNLAARLEESAKQYGIFTQVSQAVVDLAGSDFIFRELDTLRVVGKSVAVTTHELLGRKATATELLKNLAAKFKEGIALYKAQRFNEAMTIFKETLELEWQRFPELKGKKTNPSEIYIARCEKFLTEPPAADWDGVWTLTEK
jgi:adenylate cyclase